MKKSPLNRIYYTYHWVWTSEFVGIFSDSDFERPLAIRNFKRRRFIRLLILTTNTTRLTNVNADNISAATTTIGLACCDDNGNIGYRLDSVTHRWHFIDDNVIRLEASLHNINDNKSRKSSGTSIFNDVSSYLSLFDDIDKESIDDEDDNEDDDNWCGWESWS